MIEPASLLAVGARVEVDLGLPPGELARRLLAGLEGEQREAELVEVRHRAEVLRRRRQPLAFVLDQVLGEVGP